jgi:uncharacterized membrane protein
VVEKEAGGKVRWAETHDAGAAEGAMVGFGFGAVAGLIGFMLGPIALLGAPIGAGIGALVAKLKDSGFEDEDLSALGEDLGPGEAALVAVISAAQVEKARRLLNEVGVKRVEVRDLDAELASLLDREAEVAMASGATTEEAAPWEAEPPPTRGI